jgi:DNA-binding CsgD family transcriptional regulator
MAAPALFGVPPIDSGAYSSSVGLGSLSLSAADLGAVLGAAQRADHAQPGEQDVRDLLGSLTNLVGADRTYWNRSAVLPRRLIAEIGYPRDFRPDDFDVSYEEWAGHIDEHPIMSGRIGPVVSISDVYSRREFRRTWLYRKFFAPELEHEIGLHLSRPSGELHLVYLSRGPGADFSPRDRMVLELLRPHLDAAFRRLAFPPPRLTRRETEVLRCVRDGDSNTQVARRLGIAEATVEKHLEHVYDRTGARSRIQALNLCSAALDQTGTSP